MVPIGKKWSCNLNFFIHCPERVSELYMGDWIILNKKDSSHTLQQPTHYSNHISVWKHRFDFKKGLLLAA